MENLLSIAIVGALLSGVIQLIKLKFGTNGIGTKLLTLVLAFVVGGVVYFLQDSAYWENVLGLLGTVSVVYAFLLKK